MAIATSTVIGIIGLGIAAAGSAVSYSAANNAAKTQDAMALVNARAQTQAARQAGAVGSMQAQIQASLAAKEQAAANASADALNKTAEVGTKIANENTRRNREDIARLIGAQRNAIAKSGLSDTTGTPLDLLADSAMEEQRIADAARFEDENNRRSLFREASVMRNQGTMAGIAGVGALAGGAAARGSSLMAVSQARLDAFSQRAAANAIRTNATGNLLSSVGGLSQSAYSNYRTTPRGGATKQPTMGLVS